MAKPARPRPVAGRSRRVRPVAQPHAATDPLDARRGQPGPATSAPRAEPPQTEGATLPRVEDDPASGVGWLKCIDGLHGRVTRWRRFAQGPVFESIRRFDGTTAERHPRTIERHRAAVVAWLRARDAEARRG